MESLDYNTLIKRINTVLERIANSSLQEENLTVSQWRYLSYLYSRGGKEIHLKDIERYFDVSQPTVVGILRRLREKGHVYLEKSDYAANAKSVSLTESGIRICEIGMQQKESMDQLLLQHLDVEERVVFKQLLEKIYEGMQNA